MRLEREARGGGTEGSGRSAGSPCSSASALAVDRRPRQTRHASSVPGSDSARPARPRQGDRRPDERTRTMAQGPGIVGIGVGAHTGPGSRSSRSSTTTSGRPRSEDARRCPCAARRHGDDRGALGDAPLPAARSDRRLDRPCRLRDGHARSAGDERDERLRALEQPRLRRCQHREHRGSDPPARPDRGRRHRSGRPHRARSPTTRRSTSGGTNTIDAAIALTTTADVGTATLPDGYGAPSSTTTPPSVGCRCRSTGVRPDSRPDRSTQSTSTSTSATSR